MTSTQAPDPSERDTDLVALEEAEQELASLEAELAEVDGSSSDEQDAEQR